MPATQMRDLLKHELGDLLYAEQLILKMLGVLTREVNNPEVKARVQEHVGETEEQIERLKRAFESIGEKAKAEKCDAAIGLKEEHDSFKREKPSKPMLEAFDLGNSLRVEHYEIAGYRSAIAVAQVMGENECVALLTESLREEEAMATFFERNSVKSLRLLSKAMDFNEGDADVVFTPEKGNGKAASKSSGSKSGSKTARSSAAKSGSKTAESGSRSSGSKSSGAKSGGSKSASASKSSGSKSTASKSSGSKSSGSKSSGSKSGSKSARKTASKSSGARG